MTPHRARGRLALVLVLVAGVAGACGDPAAPTPTQMTRVADLSVSMVAGSSDSIRVKVSDASGSAVNGVAVVFAATAGGGSVSPTSTTTSGAGIAAAKFTSGTLVGLNTATASATGLPTVTFTATTVAGPASSITTVTNLAANTVAGAGDSIRASVKDVNGNGVGGATVTFTVTGGGGSVTIATAVTIASGVAATKWITGTTVGLNSVTATAAALTPASFSATTIAGPAARLSLGGRTVIVDAGGGAALQPTFTDANGNSSASATVTYTARNTAVATVSSSGAVATVAQGMTFVVASSSALSDSVLVVSGVSGGLVLSLIDLPRFDLKTDTVLTVTVAIDMRSSGEKLGSADIKITWDPTELTFQSDADPTSPMSVSANSSSSTAGTYLLGVASASGSSGSVVLRTLTFKTASTVGKTGALTLSATAVAGATTFTDLKSKTTAAIYPLKTR